MTPDLTNSSALAMRRRALRRRRIEQASEIVHRMLAFLGILFIILLICGALP
jgi:heme A synthase